MSKSDAANLATSRLHEASSGGNLSALRQLLTSTKELFGRQRPSIVNNVDASGYTALQKAAARGHEEAIRILLAHAADISRKDFIHGNTALHEAAWKGYSRTVSLLAAAGADLNQLNNGGFASLHLCCQNGHNQTCRELLIAGCNSNIQNNYGDTALHTSARYGHAGVTRILISAQCQVSVKNKNGDTALHIAAAMARKKLTRILVQAGCDTSLRNKQNETAHDIAVRKELREIIGIITSTRNSNVKKSGDKVDGVNLKDKKPSQAHGKGETFGSRHWSPYGCHYYPDAKNFPQPNLDTLPHEPLKKGEQYYLDLAGNICKGPIGVGYTCYCAPLFKQIETKLERDKNELKAHIDKAHKRLNHKVSKLELKTAVQISELSKSIGKQQVDSVASKRFGRASDVRRSERQLGGENGACRYKVYDLSRSRSLEVLDEVQDHEIENGAKSMEHIDERENEKPPERNCRLSLPDANFSREFKRKTLENYLDEQHRTFVQPINQPSTSRDVFLTRTNHIPFVDDNHKSLGSESSDDEESTRPYDENFNFKSLPLSNNNRDDVVDQNLPGSIKRVFVGVKKPDIIADDRALQLARSRNCVYNPSDDTQPIVNCFHSLNVDTENQSILYRNEVRDTRANELKTRTGTRGTFSPRANDVEHMASISEEKSNGNFWRPESIMRQGDGDALTIRPLSDEEVASSLV